MAKKLEEASKRKAAGTKAQKKGTYLVESVGGTAVRVKTIDGKPYVGVPVHGRKTEVKDAAKPKNEKGAKHNEVGDGRGNIEANVVARDFAAGNQSASDADAGENGRRKAVPSKDAIGEDEEPFDE